ncbi:uncharacterized protein EI90DRAFT_3019064 [Cantharellus anzutake]|uniref:uncharacterized protein n=1 Tax=Cantharellus anzutake TaxID=1750568 RepID=UPI0019030196|nr:uncharacterized protein EI90DRAFT_3019064 [Cantharellus anzutake]KAF8325418.1 hypothetical protein EI90DRAFT_3019064 [Cantharellus anzutake]
MMIKDVVKIYKAGSGTLHAQLADWTKSELNHSESRRIDMTNYPGGTIVKLKKAIVEHLQKVINGWKNGSSRWVKMMAEEIEQQKKELSHLESEAASAWGGSCISSVQDNITDSVPSHPNNATLASSTAHIEAGPVTPMEPGPSMRTNLKKRKAPANPKPWKTH